MSRALLAISTW